MEDKNIMAENKFVRFIKRHFTITKNVVKGEATEIANLKPTEDDYSQGKRMAVVTIAVMASMGIPIAAAAEPVIAKVFAYGIRDLRDGIEDNNKLIISRVINEIKASKESMS